MSEEILKALTQLFAIITKQDEGVTDKEREYIKNFFNLRLNSDDVDEYYQLYENYLKDKPKNKTERPKRERKERPDRPDRPERPERRAKLTSMKDSVRTLSICKKINKTLAQKQKVIVLIELLELITFDNNFTNQRREIINTVSTVFNIVQEEYDIIEKFIISKSVNELDSQQIAYISGSETSEWPLKHIYSEKLDQEAFILYVNSVNLYFFKYIGHDDLDLNNQMVRNNRVYLFPGGSILRTSKGKPIYYSDVVALFNRDLDLPKISFVAEDLYFKFPNGHIGLRDVNINEDRGQLMGIMGASGAGKTTLLNVLAGLEQPSDGSVRINSIDIHKNHESVEGIIGYISQDDILFEELTVFENLYYNAKLCFKDKNDGEIRKIVIKTLTSLGLDHIQDLKVGNALNKKISGGQRKRLNIALELVREPAVLFVDEPTSGLSSKDSENVIDLLKQLSLKGKLIFVVIHQPSSEIFKMFDKMFIMDTGGYPIYYGSPVESIVHFKKATNQINSERGQCETCGNVNPEQVFDIIEAKVVNEFGEETEKRKITPEKWSEYYKNFIKNLKTKEVAELPANNLRIPSKIRQWTIFTIRDVKSKLSNTQYIVINLLQAPLLALLLTLLLRYKNFHRTDLEKLEYLFRFNENIPAFLLMSVVIALFMGLTISAEEIIKDRKILKREKLLNLSKNSYLLSKMFILFILSAVQTLSFVLIGNLILGINGLNMSYWLVLFSTSCFANVLGLNISSAFNSAITVYIIIPLLLIPQMVLSGALFNFEKLNEHISTRGKTPLIADVMASRWAYEALAVNQHNNNEYQKYFKELEPNGSKLKFYTNFWIQDLWKLKDSSGVPQYDLINFELKHYNRVFEKEIKPVSSMEDRNKVLANIEDELKTNYSEHKKLTSVYEGKLRTELHLNLDSLKKIYLNERLESVVKNENTDDRIILTEAGLIQQIDPIYIEPDMSSAMNWRSPLFVSYKNFFGNRMTTFTFNLIVVWFMTVFLYVCLLTDALRKLLEKIEKIVSRENEK